jgi:hypothetical protein
MDVVPGQWWQRAVAVVLAVVTAVLYVQRSRVPGAMLWLAGVALFLFVLLSVPVLYRKWMAFAEWLSVWMTRVLFSVVYLLIAPVVWVLYATTGRRRAAADPKASLWIPKRPHGRTLEDLERMG